MTEIWKPVYYIFADGRTVDFSGLYEISNTLKLKYLNYKGHKEKEKIIDLTQLNQNERYFLVTLCKGKKKYNCRVHRLMLSSFYPDTKDFESIDHIDGNTHNNSLSNIRFCLVEENINNPVRINKTQMSSICKEVLQYDLENNFIKCWKSANEIERELKFCHPSIVRCCNGKQKDAYGYIWKYKKAV